MYEYDRDPNLNVVAKKVGDTDISDMRDQKTKVRDLLQAKENEALVQLQKMKERIKKTEEMSSPNTIKGKANKAEEIAKKPKKEVKKTLKRPKSAKTKKGGSVDVQNPKSVEIVPKMGVISETEPSEEKMRSVSKDSTESNEDKI